MIDSIKEVDVLAIWPRPIVALVASYNQSKQQNEALNNDRQVFPTFINHPHSPF